DTITSNAAAGILAKMPEVVGQTPCEVSGFAEIAFTQTAESRRSRNNRTRVERRCCFLRYARLLSGGRGIIDRSLGKRIAIARRSRTQKREVSTFDLRVVDLAPARRRLAEQLLEVESGREDVKAPRRHAPEHAGHRAIQPFDIDVFTK